MTTHPIDVKDYTRARYRRDAELGLLMAAGIGTVSALPLGAIGLLNVWRTLGRQPLAMPWTTFGATVAVVWASYLIAGQLGAAAYFALRPLQRWAAGWIPACAALAVSIYGTIGYMLAMFYDPVGRTFLEDSTPAEAWRMARLGTILFAGLGALFGAYHGWRVHAGRAARDDAAEREAVERDAPVA